MVINKERKFDQEYRASNSAFNSTFNPIDENHRAYVNFISSLKSPITRKAYVIRLKNYLRSPTISFSTFDELLSRDRCTIEQGIIDILINMRYKLQLSFSAQNMFLCALIHFFSINDNWNQTLINEPANSFCIENGECGRIVAGVFESDNTLALESFNNYHIFRLADLIKNVDDFQIIDVSTTSQGGIKYLVVMSK